ncbi:unnamed protein product [Caretta caretta]
MAKRKPELGKEEEGELNQSETAQEEAANQTQPGALAAGNSRGLRALSRDPPPPPTHGASPRPGDCSTDKICQACLESGSSYYLAVVQPLNYYS